VQGTKIAFFGIDLMLFNFSQRNQIGGSKKRRRRDWKLQRLSLSHSTGQEEGRKKKKKEEEEDYKSGNVKMKEKEEEKEGKKEQSMETMLLYE